MKKILTVLTAAVLLSLFLFSLCSADLPNYAASQLEFISNALPLLWERPKEEVLRIMSIFPDFVCTDYTDQLGCVSKYNTNDQNNIFINFFMDDYEDHHDNLWKASFTLDLRERGQTQEYFQLLWLEGLKPSHSAKDEFWYTGVIPMYFADAKTKMIAYPQVFDPENNPFFLVEYLSLDRN